jgi:hypothetical protein
MPLGCPKTISTRIQNKELIFFAMIFRCLFPILCFMKSNHCDVHEHNLHKNLSYDSKYSIFERPVVNHRDAVERECGGDEPIWRLVFSPIFLVVLNIITTPLGQCEHRSDSTANRGCGWKKSGAFDFFPTFCIREKYQVQVIETNVWMKFSWMDYKMSWTPADYDNITDVCCLRKKSRKISNLLKIYLRFAYPQRLFGDQTC